MASASTARKRDTAGAGASARNLCHQSCSSCRQAGQGAQREREQKALNPKEGTEMKEGHAPM